jgi:hypothetical protein
MAATASSYRLGRMLVEIVPHLDGEIVRHFTADPPAAGLA